MKKYSFSSIYASEYPSMDILNYPQWAGVKLCVNVSERPYSFQLVKALADHGIEWVHCPLSEEVGADWLCSAAKALPKMYLAHRTGKKQIVHCDLGDNRSRAIVEALHFVILHKELEDPYRDAGNHLVYNCKEGHLPDLAEWERRLRAMTGPFPLWSLLTESQMQQILYFGR